MFGYDKKELLHFFSQEIESYYNVLTHPNYIGSGVSRSVFSFSEYPDIVFKIGFGDCEKVDDDDFLREQQTYEKAKERELACFFCPVEFLGFVETSFTDKVVPVYIQARADCLFSSVASGFNSNSFKTEERILFHIKKTFTEKESLDLHRDWYCYFIRKYGVEEFVKFITFLEDDNEILDLHEDNVAIKDGDLVLIDYAF